MAFLFPAARPRSVGSRLLFFLACSLVGIVSWKATALAQDEIFVSNQDANSVTVYARTANGNTAPLRTIVGAATGLNLPEGIALDSIHGEIFVANTGNASITVYSRAASGNASPLRTISGASTGLSGPNGIAVDPLHDELFVDGSNAGYVNVYTRTADGNATPIRTLTGAATTLHAPQGLAVDAVHDELFVTSLFESAFPIPARVIVFARTATGNTAPLRTISGASTTLSQPVGVALDLTHDEVVVTDPGKVATFSRTANGDVAPLRQITGGLTGLTCPTGLVDDLLHDELVVVNFCNNSLTSYPRAAVGDVAPLRILSGGATGLIGSVWIAAPGPNSSFYSVAPCRVADTRDPTGPYGGPALAANADRTFVIAGQCGVPVGARAVAFNLAVTLSTAPGDVRVVPAGGALPLVSALNWNAGQTRANNAVIQLGPSGDITVHPDQPSGTVHLIIDLSGYFQ